MKWKRLLRQELVVGGWLPGNAGRTGQIGSLLVGYYDEVGGDGLHYAGRVGTGFTHAELARLATELEPLRSVANPFATPSRGRAKIPKEAVFVEPRVVVEVRFTEWTAGGSVRQPAYLGQRADKLATDVVRELPA